MTFDESSLDSSMVLMSDNSSTRLNSLICGSFARAKSSKSVTSFSRRSASLTTVRKLRSEPHGPMADPPAQAGSVLSSHPEDFGFRGPAKRP